MQQSIQQYGIPLGLYSDRHTIFRSPNESLTVEQELAGETKPLSHFGKAMSELHIEHIKARTPQAKGRVERLWQTLQDRLIIELRLLGVNTLEEANAALPALLDKHNSKFAIQPQDADSAYVELDPSVNLNHVFTIREHRQLGTGNTLSYFSSNVESCEIMNEIRRPLCECIQEHPNSATLPDYKYFSRLFRKQTGTTPSEYRAGNIRQ